MSQDCPSFTKPCSRVGLAWVGLAATLLVWNGLTALDANPFTLAQGYDGTMYQLLARNRLRGHYEVADNAHTVREEGQHPMWRPGLVWVEEQLARCLGSVQAGSAAASALGITLMELAMLWLAWRCFGRAVFWLILVGLFAPVTVGVQFLLLSIRQGPETWAGAAILAGLAALVEALKRGSWGWAVLAGTAAGLAEWFRSGNLVLVGVPLVIYALAALRQRNWCSLGLTATAVAALFATVLLGGWVVPSSVNKTVINMWANLLEYQGGLLEYTYADGTHARYEIGGLKIAPGTMETYYDYIVRKSKSVSTSDYFRDHADEILPLYGERLMDVAAGGAGGLRTILGDALPVFFLLSILIAVVRPGAGASHVLALSGGALAHYLGPVVLLRGDNPTHYLFVAAPLFVLVAARGIVQAAEWAAGWVRLWRPVLASRAWQSRWVVIGLALTPLACLTFNYYQGALASLGKSKHKADEELAALDGLALEGRKVACRNMGWFIDRDIRAVLLPYATVEELEQYARAHDIDGILLWDNEPALFLTATPYGLHSEFYRALKGSAFFDAPQVSGAWRWYPVRSKLYSRGGP